MYKIKYNTNNPSKKYDVNDSEIQFFNSLSYLLIQEDIWYSPTLIRKSDGSLSVDIMGYPIGSIKLQGRKHWMSYFINLYDYKTVEGSLADFMSYQKAWIKYYKKYIRKELT